MVKKESGKHYEKHTELPKTYYAVVDTKEFKTLLGSKKQVLVYEAIDESGSSGGSMSLVLLILAGVGISFRRKFRLM